MKASIIEKLKTLVERHEEIAALLSEAEIINDQKRYRELSKEYADLEAVVASYKRFQQLQQDMANAEALMTDGDPEIKALAKEEQEAAAEQLEQVEEQLQLLLLPKDPRDNCNVFLEIRAGTGGTKQRSLSVIYSVCIVVMLRPRVGILKSCMVIQGNTVDIRKSLPESLGKMFIRI